MSAISVSPAAGLPTPPSSLPSITRNDFPTWLPATLVKELRQGLRTRGFVGTFIGFQIVMAIMMMTVAAQTMAGNVNLRAAAFATANGTFWTILTLQLLVFTPGRALGSLQLEVSSRTIDLLMLTRLDAWRIVTGKWGSLVAQSALLLVAMLPYGIVRYFAGSVDLVNDAARCAALLGGSALLTAMALWGAGMGKFFRFLIIGLVVAFSGMGSSIFSALTRGGGPSFFPASFSTLTGKSALALVWYDGALLLVFFLVAAVRNIAPRAENHTLLARSLPLLALVPVPATSLLVGAAIIMPGQLIVAGIFLLLVCAGELASLELPLQVHFRAARNRSAVPRMGLRMALPGWQSAFLYTLFATVIWLACAALMGAVGAAGSTDKLGIARLIWLAVLALEALAFPALVLSLLPRAPRGAAGVYIATLVAVGALYPVAYAVSTMSERLQGVQSVGMVFPVGSFIATLLNQPIGPTAMAFQAVFAVTVVVAAWFRTQSYWLHLEWLETRERAVKS